MSEKLAVVDTKIWPFPKPNKHKTQFRDEYYRQMRPIFNSLRLLARLSYQMKPNGEMALKFKSLWTLYTLVVYILQTCLALQNTLGIVSSIKKSEPKIEVILFFLNSFMFMGFQFYIPFIFCQEWSSIARYVNSWRSFQEEYLKYTGKRMIGNLARPVLISVLIAIPVVVLLAFLESAALYSARWFNIIPYIVVFLYINLYLLLWVFTCLQIGMVSTQLRTEISQAFKEDSGCTAQRLFRLRLVWSSLAELSRELGSVLACTMILVMIVNATSFISSCYVLLSSLVARKDQKWPHFGLTAFLFILLYTAVYLFIVVEFTHRAAQKVGPDFVAQLMRHNTSRLDPKTVLEVELFLQIISTNKPVVQLGGFFTINRSLCVSVLSSTVTYLIVLIQFKSSEDKAK